MSQCNVVHGLGIAKYEPRSEKTGLRVFDQVRYKQGCTATEDSGRVVTNVGRTCGPTLLLVHLYVKAIKYV